MSVMSVHSLSTLLDTLPYLVIRKILGYFTYKNIFVLRCVSKNFRVYCEYYLRVASEKLWKNLILEGKKINNKLNLLSDDSNEFQNNLTKYYIVQLISNEISIILYKQKLKFEYYIPGHLLDNLHYILKQIDGTNSTSEHLLDIYKKFIYKSKLYYHKPLQLYVNFLGIHIVNLLNLLKEVKYNIKVIYDTQYQTCHFEGTYYIQNFKIFKTLLNLSDQSIHKINHKLSDTEKALTLKQLILIVDLHNSFVIQSNIYERNINKGYENFFDNNIIFEKSLVRRMVWKAEQKIEEIYNNVEEDIYSHSGLLCIIDLKCALNNSPEYILKAWENIVFTEKDLFENKSSISQNSDNLHNFEIKFLLNVATENKKSCFLEGIFFEKSLTANQGTINNVQFSCKYEDEKI